MRPMRADPKAGPPALASKVLRWGLPAEIAEALSGDLAEAYAGRVAAGRGRFLTDAWYWGQALTVRRFALRKAAERLRSIQPTWERNRPHRVRGDGPDFQAYLPMTPRDLRYAVRRLVANPGFTLVAILSLGLGIGANTAMFSLVNAALLRDLPIRNAGEIVEIYTSDSGGYAYGTSSFLDYRDLRESHSGFSDVVGSRTFISRLDLGGEPLMVFGELVSGDFFRALGVQMAVGRSFTPEEDQTTGADPVAVLGYRMWNEHFGGDPGVVGQALRLDGRSYTIVGVAPERFTGSMPVLVTGLFVPLAMTEDIRGFEGQLERRGSRSMFLKARLAPGTTVERANEALKAFSSALAELYPETNEDRVMSALPTGDVALHPLVDKALKPISVLLLSVVGLVLLIACANLASFLLARAEDRRREIAVRLALGAGRGALVRQLLVETTVLAVLGGVAGILLANWTLGLLMTFQPPLPVPVSFDVSIDQNVLWFTTGISLLAGFAFGLVPALQATNPDITSTLKNEGTGGGRPRRLNLRGGLVVLQVAFSFVLLIGAGLFLRSLEKASAIDQGFDVGPGAMIWPMPTLAGYETDDEARGFYDAYRERLLADPSIDRVALADRFPLGSGIQTRGYRLPGVPADSRDGTHEIDLANVSPEYFETMGVPILRGRGFADSDMEAADVIVVSEAFVRAFYPGEDVIGRTIDDGGDRPFRIVGVARDTKVRTLGETPRPYIYHVMAYQDFLGMQVLVRGRAGSQELLDAARRVLRELDPDMVVFEAKTMDEHLALMLFPPRMAALLLAVFGALALTLSAIGIYGVVSYAVSKRTRELGIRMSLGAGRRDVIGLAVGGGMRLVAWGAVVGVVLAGAVTWAVKDFLYGIGSLDLATFASIPVLLMAVAFVAALVPAWRAAAVDPVGALRKE